MAYCAATDQKNDTDLKGPVVCAWHCSTNMCLQDRLEQNDDALNIAQAAVNVC